MQGRDCLAFWESRSLDDGRPSFMIFCGESDDFCGTGCQKGFGGCGNVTRPSCSKTGSSVNKRTIGYYESWSNTRLCEAISPQDLNLDGFTHVNFAFAFFDPSTFLITPMDANAASLYNQFTDLKGTYSGLETWISVGGWSFTDPGTTRTAFSDMSSSSTNRQAFIQGLMTFMDTYGFDGVDIDWEYPAADDRGGVTADKANFVSLLKDMRTAFGTSYGLSVTLPTSYWYLQHFDLEGMAKLVDWFNLMSYDLHGTWDAQSIYVGSYIAPHTNITEIDAGLDLLWRAGVDSSKVTMGTAYYGRSFTLADPSCNTPNGICRFTGGGNAGECSNASGILDDQEIQSIITANKLTPLHDKVAGVKWITWDNDQWVSYDDADTFTEKRAFANSRCLGGLMVWALDQTDQTKSNGFSAAGTVTSSQQAIANQGSADAAAQTACYTSACAAGCRTGYNEVSQMNGQPGQLSTITRCSPGEYESLCCADSTKMGTCTWRGFRGVGLSCIGTCADLETEVARNTNHHDDTGDYTCHGGLQSYCCANFSTPPTKSQLAAKAAAAASSAAAAAASNAAEIAKEAAEALAEQAAIDLAAKAFCRIAVPALLAPLELLEDLIPIVGEILDLIEIAATPALITACTDAIEKEGSAEFKIFGKEHTISGFEKPTEKPKSSRASESEHSTASDKTSSSCALNARVALRDATSSNIHETSTVVVNRRVCDGSGPYAQACLHYSSVISRNAPHLNTIQCLGKNGNVGRPIVPIYNAQHNEGWINGWMQAPNLNCQRDEYPPDIVWQGRDNSLNFVRLIPSSANIVGAALFAGICDNYADFETSIKNRQAYRVEVNRCRTTHWYTVTRESTVPALSLEFVGLAGYADAGMAENLCYPSVLVDDPGFALLTNDKYYNAHLEDKAYNRVYADEPVGIVTAGHVNNPGWNKRWTDPQIDPEDIVLNEGNSTRKPTDEELLKQFGIIKCKSQGCEDEKSFFGIESARTMGPGSTAIARATAGAITAAAVESAAPTVTSSPQFQQISPQLARITEKPVLSPADELES
ncbi:hypothetical protein VF21_03328 [Pseudogymnoascus sp. 05NY08]|nr:hypothetical protein VF21_03328 [Pseudogymnoascus sp. 05NY08]